MGAVGTAGRCSRVNKKERADCETKLGPHGAWRGSHVPCSPHWDHGWGAQADGRREAHSPWGSGGTKSPGGRDEATVPRATAGLCRRRPDKSAQTERGSVHPAAPPPLSSSSVSLKRPETPGNQAPGLHTAHAHSLDQGPRHRPWGSLTCCLLSSVSSVGPGGGVYTRNKTENQVLRGQEGPVGLP